MTILDLFWLLLFMSVALAAIPISQRYLGYWFTPLSIYIGMNALSMALYHLRLIPMVEVSLYIHLLLLASILMFIAGTALAARGTDPGGERLGAATDDGLRLNIFFYWTASLAVAGSTIATAILLGRYGFGFLISNIWALQNEFQMQYIGYLNLLGVLVMPTYVLKRLQGRGHRIDIVLVIIAVIGLLLAGIKSYLISSFLSALLVWSVRRPDRFKIYHLMLGVLIMLAYFVFYTRIIDVFVPDTDEHLGISGAFAFIHRPYLYFVGSWPALGLYLDGAAESVTRFGFVTLQPIWKLLEGLGLAAEVDKSLPFVNIGFEGFNVYSFVGEVYWDWGPVGAMIGSLLFGFVTVRLYLRAKFAAYWGHALVYGIVGFGVLLSPFMYMYRFNAIFHLLYIYILGFVILRGGVFVARRRHV